MPKLADSMRGSADELTPTVTCGRCTRTIGRGGFAFLSKAVISPRCWRCAWRYPPVLIKALQVSVLVGTILTIINQGDALLAWHLTPVLLWKVPLTYFVPYAVSTYSALAVSRRTRQ